MQDDQKPEEQQTTGLPDEMTSQFEAPKPADPEPQPHEMKKYDVVVGGKKSHKTLWSLLVLALIVGAAYVVYQYK